MAKKLKEGGQPAQVKAEVATESPPAFEREEVLFERHSWRNVKTVFKCVKCGTFRDDRDAIIEHILLHYPAEKREAMLEALLKQE